MIKKIGIYRTDCLQPHRNLAVEKLLLERVEPGQCILYLWQNQNTVVIGKNQNAWLECRTSLLEQEGGTLARRLSGGGAVFHDIGNLNFTFLLPDEDYDVDRQLGVIARACALAGIETEKSGRNDLLAQGRKFSGNAFYHSGGRGYHHGTLMVDVDKQKLSRYLSPPKAKLEAKGVTSVRSRVVNLNELAPGLTCRQMAVYMEQAFAEEYGLTPQALELPDSLLQEVEDTARLYGSWDYLYGTALPFTFQCEQRFDWGHFLLQLQAKAGVVIGVKAYSDAMDWTLPSQVEQALLGCRFQTEALTQALAAMPDEQTAQDLAAMLRQQNI